MPDTNEKPVPSRVEKKFNSGKNEFLLIGFFDSFKYPLAADRGVEQATLLNDVYTPALSFLKKNDAKGEIYTFVSDRGNGPETSSDRLLVTERAGEPTGAERIKALGEAVTRMTTEQIDY